MTPKAPFNAINLETIKVIRKRNVHGEAGEACYSRARGDSDAQLVEWMELVLRYPHDFAVNAPCHRY